ncbi:MAG: LysM peptidoglycan-binding domain-containing protein [Candidatus Kerfeldbacteria bacterium]|nr:LysM peptidoglycan-binding domain-containing protein [Candidatus Kerfeldbacteria bacterium]
MKANRCFRAFNIVVVALLGLAYAAAGSAIEYEGLGGRPANPDPNVPNSASWFLYQLPAGATKEDALRIENGSGAAVELIVYPADQTPSSDGGFALKQRAETMTELGSWVTLYPTPRPVAYAEDRRSIPELCQFAVVQAAQAAPTADVSELKTWCGGVREAAIRLEPDQAVAVPFVIRIPDNADVGEHAGGLVLERKRPADEPSAPSGGVQLTTRVGVRIYETVPGDIVRQLELTRFTIHPNARQKELVATVGVLAAGNVSIDHTTTLSVSDTIFRRSSQTVERATQALRGQELITNISLPLPRFGRFSYQAQVAYTDTDGAGQRLMTPTIVRWFVPWLQIAVVMLVAVAIIALWLWRRGRDRGRLKQWRPYVVRPGEDLVDIASRRGIDWRVLAKANGLKPPYRLKAGQTIKVPIGS